MAGDGSWQSNHRKNSLSQQMFSQSVSDHMSLYSGMNSRYKVKTRDREQANYSNSKDTLLWRFVREVSANQRKKRPPGVISVKQIIAQNKKKGKRDIIS